jgi:HD-like signal output (HDOD) protein
MQGALDANNAGVAFAVAEQQFIEIDHGTAGAYLLALWGIPHEVVEAVAYHDAPDSIAHSTFDILSAVVIAHALMAEIRPDEIPRHEADSKFLAQEYLSKVQYPHSWDSLLHQATGWLAAGEVA